MTTLPSLPPYATVTDPAPPVVPAAPTGWTSRLHLYAIGGGAVLATGAVLTSIVVATSGGAATPAEVARQYVDALQTRDYRTAYESLCAEVRADHGDLASYAEATDQNFGGVLTAPGQVGEVRRDSRGWDVTVRIATFFGPDEVTLEVVEENGELLVCDELQF